MSFIAPYWDVVTVISTKWTFSLDTQDVQQDLSPCVFEVVNKRFLVPGFLSILTWWPQMIGPKPEFKRPPFDTLVTQFFNRTFNIVTLEVRTQWFP